MAQNTGIPAPPPYDVAVQMIENENNYNQNIPVPGGNTEAQQTSGENTGADVARPVTPPPAYEQLPHDQYEISQMGHSSQPYQVVGGMPLSYAQYNQGHIPVKQDYRSNYLDGGAENEYFGVYPPVLPVNGVTQMQPRAGVMFDGMGLPSNNDTLLRPGYDQEVYVDSHLGLSIFSCMCCCWCVGLAAILSSWNSRIALYKGDIDAAQRNADIAKKRAHIAIGLGIALSLLNLFRILLATTTDM